MRGVARGRSVLSVPLTFALAFALTACGDSDAAPGEGRPDGGAMAMGGAANRVVPVAVSVARAADLQVNLRGSANLRARQQVEVLPKQAGVIARILVEEGSAVRQGQVLAALDDAEWRLQARQTIARANASRDALERGRALQELGLLADQEVERLRSEAEVAAADAALAELRVQNAAIVAPIAGVVTHRRIEQGQLVATGTPTFTVADLSRLEVDLGIPEREASRVRPGQSVAIRAEEGGQPVAGRVARVRPVVDPGSGTVLVTVEIDPGQAGGLRAGQFANVDIVTETLQQRIAVPRTALLVDGPTPRLYRVVGGVAEEVDVTIGAAFGERVEVSSGIQPGDSIVIVGQDNLRPGAGVSVVEVDGVRVAAPARTAIGEREGNTPAPAQARRGPPTAEGGEAAAPVRRRDPSAAPEGRGGMRPGGTGGPPPGGSR